MNQKVKIQNVTENKKDIFWGICLFVFVLVLWLLSWYLIDRFINTDNITNSNQVKQRCIW